MQQQLNSIADTMPGLPHLQITGRLGTMTQRAVEKFQKMCGIPGNGRLNDATKKVLAADVEVLKFESTSRFTQFPGFDLRMGSTDFRRGVQQ